VKCQIVQVRSATLTAAQFEQMKGYIFNIRVLDSGYSVAGNKFLDISKQLMWKLINTNFQDIFIVYKPYHGACRSVDD
jgi:hypothetical protein